MIDRERLQGSLHFVGEGDTFYTPEEGAEVLARRSPHPGLAPDPGLPDDTRLWAALQGASGGTWRGSVYDVDRIITLLEAGKKALGW